jgi:hypothetical protein
MVPDCSATPGGSALERLMTLSRLAYCHKGKVEFVEVANAGPDPNSTIAPPGPALAGAVAFLLALAWSAIGLLLYGQDMTPNLLAELAGVSVEVAVAALIVDRLMSRHQRQQWDFAYRALAKQASEAFVDVMRLVDVRGSAAALPANLPRYGYFVQLGEQHLGDLRSHIESSATALDPHTHEQYRRVERRLSWCLGQLRTTPTHADSPDRRTRFTENRHCHS